MRFFSKLQHNLKGLYNGTFKENNDNIETSSKTKAKERKHLQEIDETYQPMELPEDELVTFSDEVLDTNSRESIAKFKHNLEILMKRAKEKGKVDKFMLIREDDFFPDGWEWRVLSKNTNLEKVCTRLSYELRKAYALEQKGINPYIEIMGMNIPNKAYEQSIQDISNVDETLGNILLPSRFRSTKHFTVNTPLEVTGNYNSVHTNRDYVFIDDINEFLASEYGYSIAYHDAYLDISHESLPISTGAIVLIEDENYDRIMSDEKIASQLVQRKIVRFKGDTDIAINMILTEKGALPSQVSAKYADYDDEIRTILDSSIRELAEKNNLFFDKSHGGQLQLDGGGHFSSYYDDKNQDYEQALNEFIKFLKQKFPEHEELFSEHLKLTENTSQEIVKHIGTTKLLQAIDEYNELASKRIEKTLEEYKEDRKNITPEIHQKFVETIHLINDFYKTHTECESLEQEEAIQKFLQGDTVKEQLQASETVCELLASKNQNKSETMTTSETITYGNEKITPAKAAENALRQSTTSTVNACEKVERLALNPEKTNEGVSIDGQ